MSESRVAVDAVTTQTLERAIALFEACIDLPAHERDRLLSERTDSPEVGELLRAMLVADNRVGDLFEIPASTWATRLDDDPDTSDALIGSTLGGFNIIGRLGQGGSSVVFDAQRDVAGARQRVALKVLRTGLFSRDGQRRFRREQSILAQLTHPNIARLIDAGVSDAGIPYIAMERVAGRPLVQHCEAEGLDRDARLRLLAVVADAVDAAHRALVVHRDLKPANVLIDQDGQVKVLDFGIAKLLDDEEETRTHHIALTPGYAAPEQYRSGPTTTAVDVYGLGVIAAELLLGARLDADAAVRPGPEADTLRRRWRALDPDLATMLRTALAEDPSRRYTSARHFADDIGHFLRKEPITAHPPSWTYRARKFIARHRWPIAVAATLVLVLIGSLVTVLFQRDRARQEAARADGMRDFMFEAFAEVEPAGPRGTPATVLDVVRRALDTSARDAGMDPRARLELRLRLAQVLQRQGELDRARDILSEVTKDATTSFGNADPLTQDALITSAHNSMVRGDYVQARSQLDALPPDTLELRQRVTWWSASAVLASRARDLERAVTDGTMAIALARKSGDDELLRTTLSDWGVVLLAADRLPEASAVYAELLALNRTRFGARDLRVANAHAALARIDRRLGDLARAETHARAAVAIDRLVYDGPDRRAAINLNALMLVLRSRGDIDGALAAGREALTINRAVLGADHPDTAIALYGVAELDCVREDFASAVPLLREALASNERRFGKSHWNTSVVRAQLGYAMGFSGEGDAGAAQLEQAITALTTLAEPDPGRIAAAFDKRIRLALFLDDVDGAATGIDRLDRIANATPDGFMPWQARWHTLQVLVALARSRPDEAWAATQRVQGASAQEILTEPWRTAERAVLHARALQAIDQREAATRAAAEARTAIDALRFVPPSLAVSARDLPR